MKENGLKCSISGSFFKFKPEIDHLIDEFRGLGITVLAPSKGWLEISPLRISSYPATFRPLPNEVGMSVKEIEDEFLRSVANSDFLYICNPDKYLGDSTCFEIGFALGKNIPCYSLWPVTNFDGHSGDDLYWRSLAGKIQSLMPEAVVELFTKTGKEGGL